MPIYSFKEGNKFRMQTLAEATGLIQAELLLCTALYKVCTETLFPEPNVIFLWTKLIIVMTPPAPNILSLRHKRTHLHTQTHTDTKPPSQS